MLNFQVALVRRVFTDEILETRMEIFNEIDEYNYFVMNSMEQKSKNLQAPVGGGGGYKQNI